MKKALIIFFTSLIVVTFALSFFMIDFLFMDTGNELTNFTLDGQLFTSSSSVKLDYEVDNNKTKIDLNIGSKTITIYTNKIEDETTYYYKNILGEWTSSSFPVIETDTEFLDTILDFKKEDFVFRNIGFYELNETKKEEKGLLYCYLTFRFDGIEFSFAFGENAKYVVVLSNIGTTRITLPI